MQKYPNDYSNCKILPSIDKTTKINYTFRLGIIGDVNVGKTSIVEAALGRNFNCNIKPSLTFQNTDLYVNIRDKVIKLVITDTMGLEKYRSLIPQCYRTADLIILVYDISDFTTFNNLKQWIKEFKEHTIPNIDKILVGNKIDINTARNVTSMTAKMFPIEENFNQYFEASSKDKTNIANIFFEAGKILLERQEKEELSESQETNSLTPNFNKSIVLNPVSHAKAKQNWCSKLCSIFFN